MSAPASARATAMACPMPRRHPVTTATLPERSKMEFNAAPDVIVCLAMAAPLTSASTEAVIRVFDGTRNRYSDSADLLITAMDGRQRIVHREFHKASEIRLEVRTFDNFRDNYTFVASASGYKQMGVQGVPI